MAGFWIATLRILRQCFGLHGRATASAGNQWVTGGSAENAENASALCRVRIVRSQGALLPQVVQEYHAAILECAGPPRVPSKPLQRAHLSLVFKLNDLVLSPSN